MILAAIDIGSNAIRLQVSRVTVYKQETQFKKLEYIRFPLRLGSDVFSTGVISKPKVKKFIKLMTTFKLLLELYEVEDHVIYATSAMREANNAETLVKEVNEKTGLKIEIISGDTEASLINRAIFTKIPNGPVLHIDVGGGSTELNLYMDYQKIASGSFKVGSVRRLSHEEPPVIWEEIEQWVQSYTSRFEGKITSIGTGGNITKLFSLSLKKPGSILSLGKIKTFRSLLSENSMDDNMRIYSLHPDRADVFVPALDIYIRVMTLSKSTKIIVPELGLKDGMLFSLFERSTKVQKV